MQSPPTLPNIPPSIAREVLANLCSALPPPLVETTEARAARDETAMAAVAALDPRDACEAMLAAQIIAANAHAMECLRLAVQPGQAPEATRSFRAQASAMMRHMQSGLRALQRTQAMREKAEIAMHPAAMERAGYWFRDVEVPAASAASDDPQHPELTEAEQYAAIYPDRAARIRAEGGLPKHLDFGPPKPAVVAALVNGSSPKLPMLDPQKPAVAISATPSRPTRQ